MTKTGQKERATQNRVVKHLQSLGYRYLGDWHDKDCKNIDEVLLRD